MGEDGTGAAAAREILTWGPVFEQLVGERMTDDPAHDLGHIQRVVALTMRIGTAEGARLEITYPAAWLHDCVAVAKDSPDRARASLLAAEEAAGLLTGVGYTLGNMDEIAHAIAAHSFSAAITPRTIEACVVQDADRLDAIGAVGIARCLTVGGRLGRRLYRQDDPFCRSREPDDATFTVDHFYSKLLKIAGGMKTASGRHEARVRTAFMVEYLSRLELEIDPAKAR